MEAAPRAMRVTGLRGWALLGLSALGLADQAQFLASNPGMFRGAPDRAAGSVLGVLLWALLAALAGAALTSTRGRWLRFGILGAAGLLTLGSVLLAVVHALARVGGLRPLLGALLSAAVLALALVIDHRHGFDRTSSAAEHGRG
ncbi:MAG: hypothetical protein ACREOD_04715 [Candidatus Dormibacteria bacterium]